jgi:CRISPR-associated protein Csd2
MLLKNKIDFAVVLSVKNANPNGDPLNGNRPRTNYDNLGEISDVCIKRKIRNRLQDLGHDIFVQSDDNRKDNYRSLSARANGVLGNEIKDKVKFSKSACEKWIDVRAFGQVFAFKSGGSKKNSNDEETEKDDSVSIGIRGPVSIHSAVSLSPVSVSSMQIVKSVNGEDNKTDIDKKSSDTMGTKHRVDFGTYVFYGSINPQLATKTGFSEEDSEAIKEALKTLFENDVSSARPDGSMEIHKLYWWKHNCPSGQYSSAKVHRSLKISQRDSKVEPRKIDDYIFELEKLDGLTPQI